MMSPAVHAGLVAVPWAVAAAVLAYDVDRSFRPRITGERVWRRGRAAAGVVAGAAAAFLHWATTTIAVKRLVLGIFFVACLIVLRCSVPLKRLVQHAVDERKRGMRHPQ